MLAAALAVHGRLPPHTSGRLEVPLSTLTTILRRAGHIEDADIARVDAHAKGHRCAPFVSVLALGLADESALVHLLRNRLMLPVASPEVLHHVERHTLELVPAELAWSTGVLPVSVDDAGNLTLAMADPTDVRAVHAVADHTGAYLLRAVAPASALRAAVEHHYGPEPSATRGPPTPLQTPAAGGTLPPIAEDAPPLSPEAFAHVLPRLVGAADRDAIMEVLLDFLAEGFERVVLFIHLDKQLRGRDARGADLLTDAVAQVRIPTTGSSVFSQVVETGVTHFGPWPTDGVIDHAFAEAFGGITGNALVLPVRIRTKVPVVVFASGSARLLDSRSLDKLASAVQTALERLIFQRKSMEVPKVR